MSPAAAMAAGAGPAARPWAKPPAADSGLRLLVGGAARRQLRWSPDPGAPEARPLAEGEVRLAIRWIELSARDLAAAPSATGLTPDRTRTGWQPLAAIGCAEVLESRLDRPAPGQWMLGPLHVGTHRVLRVISADAAGCIAVDAAGNGLPQPLHYAWIAPAPACTRIIGRDAVEQAVQALRERSGDVGTCLRLSLSPAVA